MKVTFSWRIANMPYKRVSLVRPRVGWNKLEPLAAKMNSENIFYVEFKAESSIGRMVTYNEEPRQLEPVKD